MTTVLGTQLGTRLGTYLGDQEDERADELVALEDYLAKNLFSWMRADARSESGGKVTAFWDKVALVSEGAVAPNARSVDPGHAFAQGGAPQQVAAVTTSALWNGREVAAFTGAQQYASTLAGSAWSFLYSGTGCEVGSLYSPTSLAGNYAAWSTFATGTPAAWLYAILTGTNSMQAQVAGAAGAGVYSTGSVGSVALSTPVYVDYSFATADTPDIALLQNKTTVSSGDGVSPAASGGTQTLMIGALTAAGGNRINALMPELMVANKSTPTLKAAMRRYAFLRYNLPSLA